MGLEGRKVSDDVVMFGEPLSEKVLNKLKARSPTADSIIKSLPPSAFIPIARPKKATEIIEEVVEKPKPDTAKERRERKKLKSQKKVEKPSEEILINQIIKKQEVLENKMDLEKELEALSQQAEPKIEAKPVIQEETQQVDLKDQILTLLKGEPDAPTEETVVAWKERYGRSGIHVMAFGEGEVYIYHHLTRGEWKKLKELMAKLQESANANEIEEQLKEKVVMHCILWPSVDPAWLEMCKAGVIDSLYQMILLNSGFLTPQQAMLLTTQL